jgi:ribosomal protein L7/L12
VDRVGLIKTIRTWDRRRLGLKEAKDMSDVFGGNNRDVVIEINMPDRGNAVRDFAKIGVTAY